MMLIYMQELRVELIPHYLGKRGKKQKKRQIKLYKSKQVNKKFNL